MDGPGWRHGGSRRWFLSRAAGGVAAGTLLLAGCGRGVHGDVAGPEPRAASTGDDALVERARATCEQVLATCLVVRRAFPDLDDLDAVVARHRSHVATLTPEGGAAGGADGTASPDRDGGAAPTSEPAARRRLVGAERTASEAHAVDAEEAESGDLARLLASVAAAEAQLVLTLAGAAAPGSGDER